MVLDGIVTDNEQSTEYIVEKYRSDNKKNNVLGIALFPEAASCYKRHNSPFINVDDYVDDDEHRNIAEKCTEFAISLNQNLESGSSFTYKNLDLLKNHNFYSYLRISNIFYLFTAFKNIFKENKFGKIYVPEFKIDHVNYLDPRPRSILTASLKSICQTEGITLDLIPLPSDMNCNDRLYGLDLNTYSHLPGKLSEFFKLNARRWRTDKKEVYLRIVDKIKKNTNHHKHKKQEKIVDTSSVLYISSDLNIFGEIINSDRLSHVTHLIFNPFSGDGIYKVQKNAIYFDAGYLTKYFGDIEVSESIKSFISSAKEKFASLASSNDIRKKFVYKGYCYFDILTAILGIYLNKSFINILKIYSAFEKFVDNNNVLLAVERNLWNDPSSDSIFHVLKSKGIKTASIPHGQNIINKETAAINRGFLFFKSDIFFSSGSDFVKAITDHGFRSKKSNYITGYDYIKSERKIKNPLSKRLRKFSLGLARNKHQVIFPFHFGWPHLTRANGLTYFEEYQFVKKLIRLFQGTDFQLVIKGKAQTIPDKNYLQLLNNAYPNTVYRVGPMNLFLTVTEIMINYNSNSGFDALYAGVPVIYCSPHNRDNWYKPYASVDGNPNFFFYSKTVEEILPICEKIIEGEFPDWYDEKLKEVPGRLMVSQGKDAAENIAKVISSLIN
jgi:hypothetical protein